MTAADVVDTNLSLVSLYCFNLVI